MLIYDIRSLTTDSTLTKNGLQTNLVRVGQHLGPISWKYYGRKIATGVDLFPRPEDIFAVQVRVVNLHP